MTTHTHNTETALLTRAAPYIERLLAMQGDRAEPDLIALQHAIAAAIQDGAATHTGCLPANRAEPMCHTSHAIFSQETTTKP